MIPSSIETEVKILSIGVNDVANEKSMWHAMTITITLHGNDLGINRTMATE